MCNKLKSFCYEGFDIAFQSDKNVMVNASSMGNAFNEEPLFWLNLEQTNEFIDLLINLKDLSFSDLVQVKRVDNCSEVWFHEDLAVEFARWFCPMFAIWCNNRVMEIRRSISVAEQLIENPDMAIKLLERMKNQMNAKKEAQEILEFCNLGGC